MRRRWRHFLQLLAALCVATVTAQEPADRRSCRLHFLAGESSGVLPLRPSPSSSIVSPVECRMPTLHDDDLRAVVTTVVHSALERPHGVVDSRTVGWQVKDYELLSSLAHSSRCRQQIFFNWTVATGEDEEAESDGEVTLVSFLGAKTKISPGISQYELAGAQAGILHVLPRREGSPRLPTIHASPLICEEALVGENRQGCLMDGGVQVELSEKDSSAALRHYHFALRTDLSEQTLLIANLEGGRGKIHVELVNDFFISVSTPESSGQPLETGQISDGRWHTVSLALDASHLSIDGKQRIALLPSSSPRSRIKSLYLKINGHVLLMEAADEATACLGEHLLRDQQPSLSRPFCAGESPCECTVLPSLFQQLPSPTCTHERERDDDSFQLSRHSDLLSFLLLPDSLSSDEPLRLALTFKSDSDSGLLFFGEWRNVTWGRLQVHFHGVRLTAIHCTQETESSVESCRACSIERDRGFGSAEWTRVSLFEEVRVGGGHFLTVDHLICRLLPFSADDAASAFDTAEMYKTVLSRGSVLFLGGMFNKKVRGGIYRDDFKAKFFENTREKLPSLRGCVKDVFSRGVRVDLVSAFSAQMQATLVNARSEAYAAKMGCASCSPSCPSGARCRPSQPASSSPSICDCSDIHLHSSSTGSCLALSLPPLSMSASSLSAYRGEFTIERVRGVLAKVWVKLTLPSAGSHEDIPLILFFSHGRRILFRLFLTHSNRLAVQVNPEDPQIFVEDASKEVDLGDDRVHLVSIERRTPLGTHPSKRFFDVTMDGRRLSIPDPGMQLTAIELALMETEAENAGCILDFGISYDYDEHKWNHEEENRIQEVNVMSAMVAELALPSHSLRRHPFCGLLDPLFWTSSPLKTAPFGRMLEYSPEGHLAHSGQPLASIWLFYSLLLTILLALVLLCGLCFYFCFLRQKKSKRRRRKASDDDRERMMKGESPDYHPAVHLRKHITDRSDSCISDSIDRTDISAYDDVKMHKVKVDRESMISFLEPQLESTRTGEAILVKRSPSPSDAPLVNLADIGQ